METGLHIRQARESDARQLAVLHVRAWQWAYRGQIPDSYLDGLTESIDRREAWRRERARQGETEDRTWVADASDRIVGFADTGPSRDDDAMPGRALLYALYVDPGSVRRGVGRALQSHALEDLRRRGFDTVTLWALATNTRARSFYEATGWIPGGVTKIDPFPGFDLHEVRYTIDIRPSRQTGARAD